MTMLNVYWPSYEEINNCIKAEAETASDAVLLAVHQPTPLSKREAGAFVETPVTEHDLLEAFLTEDLPEGTLLLPITGISGVGKSHMVRWLAAQLDRDKRGHRMHVIRIPKSANLRTVVKLILEPLAEDTRYADVRDKLETAVSEVKPQDGATRFAAELKISLRDLADELKSQIQNDSTIQQDRGIRAHIYHASKLPDFFADSVLQEHFETNVLARIVERAICGRDATQYDDEMLPQFSGDDLIIPLYLDLGKSSKAVQTYYKTMLNREGGTEREVAAKVLNSVVDQAIRRVFHLDQAIGGITLGDIILRIRELLFDEKRELVLLVEDFAALSGIQEVLLNVCIQEAVRDGKQIRAPMRTALAMTDGYLASRDTILTRAKREWVIRSTLDEPDDILRRSVNLVGAYLNAARWGEEELMRMFNASPRETESDLTGWIATFDAPEKSVEEADIVTAFGTSDRGEPLFPFNVAAIHTLAERFLQRGGQFQFNPRRVINFILREVLMQRDDFEQGLFPPPDFQRATPAADVAAWLAQAPIDEKERERLRGFVVYWGNSPQTPEDVASIQPKLFQAFNLPSPQDLGQVPHVLVPPSKPEKDEEKQPKPKQLAEQLENPEVKKWREKLNKWAGGTELGQQDANKLRRFIVSALEKHIDWNAIFMIPRPLKVLVTIPNARGNEAPVKYRLPIADDHTDPTGEVRQALLAVVRCESARNNWNYPDGDQDSALFANMLEKLSERVVPLLVEERDKEIGPLVNILVRQGLILGMGTRRMKPPDDLAAVAVSVPPSLTGSNFAPESDGGKWEEMRNDAINLRPELRRELLYRIACFQGETGRKPFAIDVSRLGRVDEGSEDDFINSLSGQLKAHVTSLRVKRLQARIRPLIKHLRIFFKNVSDDLGESLDKIALINGLKELLDVLEAGAAWPDGDFRKRRLIKDIDEFRNTPLIELLDQIKQLLDDDLDNTSDTALYFLGRIDFSLLVRMQDFLERVKDFLQAAERKVEVEYSIALEVNPEADALAVETQLNEIYDNLQALGLNEVIS